jgi:hypothetical protein
VGTREVGNSIPNREENFNHNLSFAALRSGACAVVLGMQYCRSLSVKRRGRNLPAFEQKEKRRCQMYLGGRI